MNTRVCTLALALAAAIFNGCGGADEVASHATNSNIAEDQTAAGRNRQAIAPSPHASTREDAPSREPEKIESALFPNAYRIHEKVISGGQPAGDMAFAELAALGVKTVISVDGATPDVEAAKQHGLRYVHLPHGYDGISDERVKQLAKAVRDLPGPVYIHCHHGKHRSPAAATAACVAVGFLAPEQALGVLTIAGTSANYQGLYGSATKARKLDEKLLDELQVEFRETVEIPPMAEAMVEIEHTHDHLKHVAANNWQPTVEHPDIDPPHEVLLLREHFTELIRTDEARAEPRFLDLLQTSQAASLDLESQLRDQTLAEPARIAAADAAFAVISNNCATCHREFRDNPGR